jgi:hypothetical protein
MMSAFVQPEQFHWMWDTISVCGTTVMRMSCWQLSGCSGQQACAGGLSTTAEQQQPYR